MQLGRVYLRCESRLSKRIGMPGMISQQISQVYIVSGNVSSDKRSTCRPDRAWPEEEIYGVLRTMGINVDRERGK